MLFDAAGNRLAAPVEYDLSIKQKEENGLRFSVEVSLNPRTYNVDVTQYIKEKLT
jgi:hypothetical protein